MGDVAEQFHCAKAAPYLLCARILYSVELLFAATTSMNEMTNRLVQESSPYLLQHADNPVHWQPWDDQALASARQDNKPILLSIGYSACHWCHVMAHESFEDEQTAALMNKLFVNIKVDREERPDLDRIYQLAHQMLVQRPGGWPLTMFLTPDSHTPFFGGTYFPPTARHGLPGFRDLLERVASYFHQHASGIHEQANAIRQIFERLESGDPQLDTITDGPINAARQDLARNFDDRCGGFGQAPRFPHAPALERLLRHWRQSALDEEPDVQALFMAALTLRRMAEGGINDQLAGGFCRYSVDDYWMIPHFEKMLYDNALLLPVYAQAAQATGEQLFRQTAERTADWMLDEMQSPEGGFYAALDADSEGGEGSYYIWTRDEVRELLNSDEYSVFEKRYGLDRPANFEGQWHLHVFKDMEEIAASEQIDTHGVSTLLATAQEKLLLARAQRSRPGLDNKVLTAWNALAIAGLAVAAVALQRPAWADAATRAVDFLRNHCWHSGRLLASWREGRARYAAYLDDYAFLGLALTRLLEARWRASDLALAIDLAEVILRHFADHENGAFFFTSDDHEDLIHRPKPFSDDATPSGNAVATQFLSRLGHLLGETRYIEAAERTLAAAGHAMQNMPSAHCSFINALEEHLAPLEVLVIRGAGEDLERWRKAAQAAYTPARMVLAIPADARGLPGALADRRPGNSTLAYYCTGMTCRTPITRLEDLTRALMPRQGEENAS